MVRLHGWQLAVWDVLSHGGVVSRWNVSRQVMAKKPSGRPAHRPITITPEIQATIAQALEQGNYRVAAFGYAGVANRTGVRWMQRGKEETSGPFFEFRKAVLAAEKRAEIKAVGLIMKAAESDPKHAEWWLSHRWSERWADKSRIKAEVKTTRVDERLDDISTEALIARLKELEREIKDEETGEVVPS